MENKNPVTMTKEELADAVVELKVEVPEGSKRPQIVSLVSKAMKAQKSDGSNEKAEKPKGSVKKENKPKKNPKMVTKIDPKKLALALFPLRRLRKGYTKEQAGNAVSVIEHVNKDTYRYKKSYYDVLTKQDLNYTGSQKSAWNVWVSEVQKRFYVYLK